MNYLLKNGTVYDGVNPARIADIEIMNGIIQQVGTALPQAPNVEVLDLAGKCVTPGLIDMHVHLREPGLEAKEDIAHGVRAAACGGFTAIACMPNTKPVMDNAAMIEAVRHKARQQDIVRVYPIGAITKQSESKELAEMGDMVQAGAVGFSDDGKPVYNSRTMLLALQYARPLGVPLLCHCEDPDLAGEGVMHEGYMSTVLGMKGIPAVAEEVMVARDLLLAEYTHSRLHICHISTANSVELVRNAKSKGVSVTCEVTPHHLILTDEAVRSYDTNTKVNPPLRTKADVAALRKALSDGIIDVIATDHAPHCFEEKDVEYRFAPFGISGLETALPLVLTELVHQGLLTMEQLVQKMSVNPANILHVPGGCLTPGQPADITVIDLQRQHTIDTTQFYSKGKNSPFNGRNCVGQAVLTMVGGQIVMQDGGVLR